MFPDLPEHLQTLNTLSPSPPSGGMTQEYEDAVWKYLNTDDVFNNLGTIPSDMQAKEEVPTPAPTQAKAPSDLKSFVAQFAREAALPLPLPYNVTASSSAAPNPLANGVNTLDIMPLSSSTPWEDETSEDGRISGAKKLKQIGAGTGEIEEDKRRRNTEASARFRAKKKEREQALEQRAKELETQVAQLTADKASLENQNKLLKEIVLGGGTLQGQENLQAVMAAIGAKRKRE